ncbi:phage tail tape measure protein [Dichelobacter nodosus]|uniref:phage tail tape measure protein n=1 Tax=Dichelobacter nodosus TaxID=870 RepID=UPI0009E638E0|nr:phage tail tape measure protein [Dichelobacter nodosus]
MADLNLNIQLRAFDKASKQFEHIRNSANKLMKQFDGSRKALGKLNEQIRDINKLEKLKKHIESSQSAITKMRSEMVSLRQQLKNADSLSETKLKKLRAEYGRTREQMRLLFKQQYADKKALTENISRLDKAGIKINALADEEKRLRREANLVNDTLNQQVKQLEKINARQLQREKRMQIASSTAITGYAAVSFGQKGLSMLSHPIDVYKRQEQAAADLKVTMMRRDGTSGEFDTIREQAQQLGAVLPGTTEDFIALARALKEQGISDKLLTSGGLKTAAQLSVLMNMGMEEGGTFTAKMIEAHRLNPNELGDSANKLQQAYHAFGLKQEDMAESMKYYAPTVNGLGLTGGANFEKLLAIQGMAARQGLEGSMFGTNFSTMLNKMASGPRELKAASSGLKAAAQDALEKAGVSFDFFRNGKIKDIEDIVKELEKFDVIRQKLGDDEAIIAMQQMFGTEGGRVAKIIAQQGFDGYKQAIADMSEQADLQTRITAKTATLSSSFEQLAGTSELLLGTIGSAVSDDLRNLANWGSHFIEETIQPWIQRHPKLVKGIILTTAAFAGLSVIAGAFLLIFSGAMTVFSSAAGTFVSLLPKISRVRGLLHSCVPLLSKIGGLLRSLLGAAVANPIMSVIAVLIAGAYLLYKNWNSVVSTSKQIWSNFSSFWHEQWQLLQMSPMQALFNIGQAILNWSPIGMVYMAFAKVFEFFGVEMPTRLTEFIQSLGSRLCDSIKNWDIRSAMVDVINSAINAASQLLSGLVEMAKNIGNNIATGLKNGISNAASSVSSAAKSMATNAVNGIKEKLQIRSPSRVMIELGRFIPQGLAAGIRSDGKKPISVMQNVAYSLSKAATVGGLATLSALPTVAAPINNNASLATPTNYMITININGNATKDDAKTIALVVRRELDARERQLQSRNLRRLTD